jgi:CubicO group peptidase (beta-lactamase class C family)
MSPVGLETDEFPLSGLCLGSDLHPKKTPLVTGDDVPRLQPGHRSLVAGILANRNIPGVAVGIVERGELSAFDAFGVADIASNTELTLDSLFRVASITKTVTATAILRLRDEGKLDLDDPLVRHLPEFGAVRARRGSLD